LNRYDHQITMATFSRREFLKLCGLSLFGLALPGDLLPGLESFAGYMEESAILGRVTLSGHKLYAAPDTGSTVLEELEKDSIRQITGATVSEDSRVSNRVWYELDGQGYAHSSQIQPVMRKVNKPASSIPDGGCLGEVTVPYVDAYTSTDEKRSMTYRLYYSSTFWITDRLEDSEGTAWYQLLDDYNYGSFFVPAANIRLVPDSELTEISPDIPFVEKKIVVDLEAQTLTAYESEKPVFMARVSSGVRMSEGGFATPRGYFRTLVKRPCRHMVTQPNEFGSGFDLPGVPWVSYFTSEGVALHGAYWHNNFGVPSSHGCVNMTPQAAKWIYRWTVPTVPPGKYYYAGMNGTQIIVQ
jgi:hypothetical protein